MKNQMLSLGKVLNRSEQKLVTGGIGTLTHYGDEAECGGDTQCGPVTIKTYWEDITYPGRCVGGTCSF